MSIDFALVSGSSIASGTFIEQQYKRAGVAGPIPQRIALLGQYNSGKTPADNTPYPVTSADEVAAIAGTGSMAHRMAIKLFAGIGSGSVLVDYFPLEDGVGTAAGEVAITGPATGAGTFSLYIGGEAVKVAVASGDTHTAIAAAVAAAINAAVSLPVTATSDYGDITITAKNPGLAGEQIDLRMDYATGDSDAEPAGVSVIITDMSGGTTDPSIATALVNLAGTFYTWVVCPFNTDTSLDLLEAAGDLRIGPSVKKPFVGVVGYNGARADFITWLSSRNSPWTTAVPVELSPTHPAEIAASCVGVCAVSANSEPARPFKTLPLRGVMPGNQAPWTYAQIDAIEALGGSATKELSGVVSIYDLLTTYTTNTLGAVDESWRYTVTVTNIQAKLYSIDQMFAAAPFDRAVVVDDNTVTAKSFAVSPKRVKGFIINLIDQQWIPEAWSKNRDAIVAGIVVEINSTNPGRIDILIPDIIAVGLRIIAVKYQWSFAAA